MEGLGGRVAGLGGDVGGMGEAMRGVAGGGVRKRDAERVRRGRQAKQVRWVLDAPTRIEGLVRAGRGDEARAVYEGVRPALDKWEGAGGVEGVRRACEDALGAGGGGVGGGGGNGGGVGAGNR